MECIESSRRLFAVVKIDWRGWRSTKKKINERGSNNSMYVRPLGGVVVGRIIAQGFASNRIDSLQCTHSAVRVPWDLRIMCLLLHIIILSKRNSRSPSIRLVATYCGASMKTGERDHDHWTVLGLQSWQTKQWPFHLSITWNKISEPFTDRIECPAN